MKSTKNALGDIITNIDELNDIMDEELNMKKKELDGTKDLTQEYSNLLSAMQEQEEWYLKEKTKLNADTYKYNYNKVNDMILTPQGNFSTHPDDYIIATKNPNSLGSSQFNMYVEDRAGINVQTRSVENGSGGQDIYVTLSKKIADDVANGANGWDNALATQQYRMAGRRVRF